MTLAFPSGSCIMESADGSLVQCWLCLQCYPAIELVGMPDGVFDLQCILSQDTCGLSFKESSVG